MNSAAINETNVCAAEQLNLNHEYIPEHFPEAQATMKFCTGACWSNSEKDIVLWDVMFSLLYY